MVSPEQRRDAFHGLTPLSPLSNVMFVTWHVYTIGKRDSGQHSSIMLARVMDSMLATVGIALRLVRNVRSAETVTAYGPCNCGLEDDLTVDGEEDGVAAVEFDGDGDPVADGSGDAVTPSHAPNRG